MCRGCMYVWCLLARACAGTCCVDNWFCCYCFVLVCLLFSFFICVCVVIGVCCPFLFFRFPIPMCWYVDFHKHFTVFSCDFSLCCDYLCAASLQGLVLVLVAVGSAPVAIFVVLVAVGCCCCLTEFVCTLVCAWVLASLIADALRSSVLLVALFTKGQNKNKNATLWETKN